MAKYRGIGYWRDLRRIFCHVSQGEILGMKEEIRISSPTHLGVRSDPSGFGYFGAPRKRGRKYTKHNGTDYLCKPGQNIYCPIYEGKIVRRAFPYDDHEYEGLLIEGLHISVMLFYVDVWDWLLNQYVRRDDNIGIAQDITKKYGEPMKPHVHLTVTALDPELLK